MAVGSFSYAGWEPWAVTGPTHTLARPYDNGGNRRMEKIREKKIYIFGGFSQMYYLCSGKNKRKGYGRLQDFGADAPLTP